MKSLEKGERSYLQIPFSQARFLEVLAKSIKAKNVLEIGTFRGFSTAFLARALPEDGVVFTCDEDSRYISAARRFWEALGVDEKIHFELDMASKTLSRLVEDEPTRGFFDLVFIDADKENYRLYVEQSMELLRDGGLMIIDNTLWKGLVEFEDPHDNGAIHMKKFNSWVFESYGRDACLVPGWDGAILIWKR
jgi:predicted O-methyltransferase YrrM